MSRPATAPSKTPSRRDAAREFEREDLRLDDADLHHPPGGRHRWHSFADELRLGVTLGKPPAPDTVVTAELIMHAGPDDPPALHHRQRAASGILLAAAAGLDQHASADVLSELRYSDPDATRGGDLTGRVTRGNVEIVSTGTNVGDTRVLASLACLVHAPPGDHE